MPTSLTATKIKDTYGQVLHVDGGVTSTPKSVYDGDGTATALKVSTTDVQVNNSPVLTDADIGSTVQAYDADLTAWSGKTAPTGAVVGTNDTQTLSSKTFSDNPTLSGGTANGVAYLNGSKVLTTGSALTWNGSFLSVNGGIGAVNGNQIYSYNSDNTNYVNVSNVGATGSTNGQLAWTIGNVGEQMRLTSTGLGIGTSTPNEKLEVYGGSPMIRVTATGAYAQVGYYSGSSMVWNSYAATASGDYRLQNSGGDRLILNSSGNLGLGVTPSAWGTLSKTLELGAYASISGNGSTGGAYLANNAILSTNNDSTGWLYKNSDGATLYKQGLGTHKWYTAPSGTAGNAISFTQAMTLDASGRLGIGISSPSYRLHINNAGTGVAAIVASDGTTSDFFVYPGVSSGVCRIGPDTGAMSLYTAGTERMRIDSSGNVGIGTSSPNAYAKLTLYGNSSDVYTGLLLLDDSTAYATGVGGRIGFSGKYNSGGSSASWAAIAGIKENATDGNYAGALHFSTRPNGGIMTERMRIDSSGNLLVGKTAASVSTVGFETGPSGSTTSTMASSTNSQSTWNVYSTGAAAYRFYVGMGGTVYATNTTISAISDQRYKENIRDLNAGLNEVLALKPRVFDWKEGKGKDIKNDRGFIAQEFEQVFPDLIDEWKDPAPEGEEPYKSVRQDLIPVLVKAIQELKAELDATKAEVAALKGN